MALNNWKKIMLKMHFYTLDKQLRILNTLFFGNQFPKVLKENY